MKIFASLGAVPTEKKANLFLQISQFWSRNTLQSLWDGNVSQNTGKNKLVEAQTGAARDIDCDCPELLMGDLLEQSLACFVKTVARRSVHQLVQISVV